MKIILLAAMLACSIASFGQITLEHSWTSSDYNIPYRPILLAGGEEKIFVRSGNTLELYNDDYSLFKSFSIPASAVPSGSQVVITAISNALFDTDESDIEYMLTWYGYGGSGSGTIILDETGTALLNVSGYLAEGGFSASDIITAIFELGDKTILRLKQHTYSGSAEVRFYTLPGKIAKDCCCDNKPKKNKHGNDPMGPSGSGNMQPNPITPGVELNYHLPEGVAKGELRITDASGVLLKTVSVGSQFNQVILDAGTLQSGTYYYQLFVDGQARDGQVIMVVK